MPSTYEEGDRVPIAINEERTLPDARGQVTRTTEGK
jgi:hypothetical protein